MADCNETLKELETFLDGELTAQGDRLAALGNDTIRLYDVPGGPLNAPVFRCAITGFAGKASGPTWSPDGRTLAWGEDDGIHAMRLDDLGACGSAQRTLLVPGGSEPDFGPADGPKGADPVVTPGGDGGGAGAFSVSGIGGGLSHGAKKTAAAGSRPRGSAVDSDESTWRRKHQTLGTFVEPLPAPRSRVDPAGR